jgi:twitching motility protein PilJ
VQIDAENIYREYLLLRQSQTEYLASENKRLADGYDVESQKLKGAITSLLAKVSDPAAKETLDEVQKVIGAETAEFENIVAVFEAIAEESEGSEEGVSTTEDLEVVLRKLPNSGAKSNLLILLLEMQRAEQQFLAYKQDEQLNEFDRAAAAFLSALASSDYSAATQKKLKADNEAYQDRFSSFVDQVLLAEESRLRLGHLTDSLRVLFREVQAQIQEFYNTSKQDIAATDRNVTIAYGIWLALVAIASGAFIYLFGKDLIARLRRLVEVMGLVNDGDLKARTGLTQSDELGQVGETFDRLLDERISDLEKIEEQNNVLNDSIISLIQKVGTIANNKDFTVRVPVAGDVTGAVSDSVNLLVSEVSSVLSEVVSISSYLGQASQVIVTDAEKVVSDSSETRQQVEEAVGILDETSKQMQDVSEQSILVASWADNTINQTQSAYEAVTKSVTNINSIREIISETEKRIKRLGERSQEIKGIVNLINNIAERTHILALNASMHAASAGEAGRGFAVVADEVQRLAENAREATAEISTLVNNIHVETTDTVTIMNKVITQVAEGTQLADEAGGLMSETKVNTAELVNAIKHIAEDATKQAKQADEVRGRMVVVEEATRQIDDRLGEQKRNSDSMENYSRQLVSTISVFRLEGSKDADNS